MSAPYIRLVAPLILSLITACVTLTTPPVLSRSTPAAAPTMLYVTGSRLAVPTSSGATQGAQPVQSIGQQQIRQSGQTNMSDALRILVPAQQISSGGITGGQ